jgi:hypothetical protein
VRTRLRYIALEEAREGMELGAPINLASHGMLRVALPAGHALTEDNLRQLAIYGGEFITVVVEDRRSDEQVAIEAATAARRLMEIFSGADVTKSPMAELFDQILAYRSE